MSEATSLQNSRNYQVPAHEFIHFAMSNEALLIAHTPYRPKGGCWVWRGPTGYRGYGRIKVSRRAGALKKRWVQAHRLAYEVWVGEIPEGRYVLHRCDNPPCVCPDHLFLGTQADNMTDMARKGRARNGGPTLSQKERALRFLERIRTS